jgi:hypothetical protein
MHDDHRDFEKNSSIALEGYCSFLAPFEVQMGGQRRLSFGNRIWRAKVNCVPIV